jgi:lysozyme
MPHCNCIIDISHHNQPVDLVAAKADGILGVFHKATEGLGFVDDTYAVRRQLAADAGLLWGAYHFGTGADGVAQAQHFLAVAQPGPDDLLVLDFEPNEHGPTMTMDQARDFVTHLQSVTGRWPGFYSGSLIKQQLGGTLDPVLASCWFWLSEFGPRAVVPPNWSSWTMWQYTDGNVGPQPHSVAGIGKCDRDQFNGTPEELTAFWKAPVPVDGPQTGDSDA